MPCLNVKIAQPESAAMADQIVSALMKRTVEIPGKKPEVTSIEIDFIAPDRWFVGGARISDQDKTAFISI
jgi:4-oxalocrotonate tautomerase